MKKNKHSLLAIIPLLALAFLFFGPASNASAEDKLDSPQNESQQETAATKVTVRKTYMANGQAIAQRTIEKENDTELSSELHFIYSDHLGSANTFINSKSNLVKQSVRFYPFGEVRTANSQLGTISDHGFTGHHENREIGLTYMNARYFVPGLGKFASADTIVPNPQAPQRLNRYAYVSNNPLVFNDPSGHCQGHYDINTGVADDDQACWDFLTNDFCAGGQETICQRWQERVAPRVFEGCWGPEPCLASFGSAYWTLNELMTLRDSIGSAIQALSNAGYDGQTILGNISFTRQRGRGSIAFPYNHVGLGNVTELTIWHEMAHHISFRNGRVTQDEYYNFAEGFVSAANLQYEWDNFCFRDYCAREYPHILRGYTGQGPEYWADAFAAWVYMETNNSVPDGSNGAPNWIRDNNNPNWQAISRGVEWSLIVTFN